MKVICIGRNYADHAIELKNDIPDSPLVFFKPDSAVIKDDKPFFYPPFSNEIHYEGEIVLRIGKEGKHISKEFALNYIDGITVGLDFTARDLQDELKKKGHPWERAKAFDGSAVVGIFIPYENIKYEIRLEENNLTLQQGDTTQMIFDFTTIISDVSKFVTLKKGDLIFTGTPKGVGPISIGKVYKLFLNGEQLLSCEVK
jgi:2-keto-4-pentenoate hydratase/2-oxohepta-3-ene-1,7-dioic acid hydratase in catechol pathway